MDRAGNQSDCDDDRKERGQYGQATGKALHSDLLNRA
jgi:hypothetical protein